MIRLLIADDELLERDAIKLIIQSNFDNNVQVVEAKNGREAIEKSFNFFPDIVIMDLKMPGIDGISAIREIRKYKNDTYFIILTAYDYFEFAKEAIEFNVKEYILKPLDKEDFIKKIYKAMEYIKKTRQARLKSIDDNEKIMTLLKSLESDFVYSVINNQVISEDYENISDYFNLDFKDNYSMVVNLEIDKSNKKKVFNYIKDLINDQNSVVGCYKYTNSYIYFISSDKKRTTSKNSVILDSKNLAKIIVDKIKKKYDINIAIGIGLPCYGGENINKSYKEAVECLVELKISDDKYMHYEDLIKSNIDEKKNIFSKVRVYIDENYDNDLELETLSKNFNLSSYYFSRTFKEYVGMNVSEYIIKIRMEKAIELLKTNNIKDICYLVGYNDPNYFSRAFKKYTGVCPSEYKI
ncbi:MAG: response regulator [Clostridiaceae bacterium]